MLALRSSEYQLSALLARMLPRLLDRHAWFGSSESFDIQPLLEEEVCGTLIRNWNLMRASLLLAGVAARARRFRFCDTHYEPYKVVPNGL
jgi:hypothetical protein